MDKVENLRINKPDPIDNKTEEILIILNELNHKERAQVLTRVFDALTHEYEQNKNAYQEVVNELDEDINTLKEIKRGE